VPHFLASFREKASNPDLMSTVNTSITPLTGDLFSAPENSILVHACNTKGSWGAGIALAFRSRFPEQYEQYRNHCAENMDALVGTCLLLPAENYTVACLFTSRNYGRHKDSPDQILAATKSALEDLVRQNTEGKELHAWYVILIFDCKL
jgi:ADP-ribose 1''-phosphate phosphatase